MKKLFALLLAALMVVSMFAGCSKEEKKSTLVYGSGDYDSINPIMNEHCEIKHLLFDSLVKLDKDGKPVASLAESWTYDDATLTYTFKLRSDVKWHDGEKFTADDVKFTIEAIMNPDNGSENYPNYIEIKEIKVNSDTEIAFVLSEPNYAFLDYMTMSILPEHKLQGEDMWESDYFKNPIGTGPYKLESWDVGQAITMVKNEEYFGGAAKINTIIFKIVTDDNAKALQLKEGTLDLAQVTPKDAQNFKDSKDLTVYDMNTADYRGILYNFWNPYWQTNGDLIPAISYCIDRQAIVDAVLLGEGFVAYSPIQLNEFNYDGVEKYDFDLAKAEAAFVAAGCEKDAEGYWCRNGQRISFTINATPGDQVRIDMAQIAAQQLTVGGQEVQPHQVFAHEGEVALRQTQIAGAEHLCAQRGVGVHQREDGGPVGAHLANHAHQSAGLADNAVVDLQIVAGSLVNGEGGGPVGHGMLRDHGGLQVAGEIRPLGLKTQ